MQYKQIYEIIVKDAIDSQFGYEAYMKAIMEYTCPVRVTGKCKEFLSNDRWFTSQGVSCEACDDYTRKCPYLLERGKFVVYQNVWHFLTLKKEEADMMRKLCLLSKAYTSLGCTCRTQRFMDIIYRRVAEINRYEA